MKFYGHPKAQAQFFFDGGSPAGSLVSYKTTVVEIDCNGWLYVNGLYSMTTRRHIGWFMAELGLTYQFAKELYENNQKYNVLTGEVQAM